MGRSRDRPGCSPRFLRGGGLRGRQDLVGRLAGCRARRRGSRRWPRVCCRPIASRSRSRAAAGRWRGSSSRTCNGWWWWSHRMTLGLAVLGLRRTSWTRERWPVCCGKASLRRCGCRMSAAGFCAAGWRAANSSHAPAPVSRTRSMPRCSAGLRNGRRALICSASRAGNGWLVWSCRWRSARRSTPVSGRSSSWTLRSRRSSG